MPEIITRKQRKVVPPRPARPQRMLSERSAVLLPWIQSQALNVNRHAAALRPFTREEFGPGMAAPSEGHIQATNELIETLRQQLVIMTKRVGETVENAIREPSTANLQRVLVQKDVAHHWVQSTEKIWDFYLELFGQRQSPYGEWLVAVDRIALDCYQAAYTGIGIAKSIPAPPPFCYMRTGFSPATFRRGIPLRKLGQHLNPFPLVQLPYHRLVNPWTLGAVLHEVSHNLQSDLGLSHVVPKAMARTLLDAGFGKGVAMAWTRWNRELFADVSALLLGGPAVVGSLMDVVGRSPEAVTAYSSRGPHPTPYLRVLISTELLRRMGFRKEALEYRQAWMKMYPDPTIGSIPPKLLETFEEANRLIIDTVCYQPYEALGGKSFSEVIRFEAKDQQMIEEAARRIAVGNDPGIIPARYLIGAARFAIDHRLAQPEAVKKNFYLELVRR